MTQTMRGHLIHSYGTTPAVWGGILLTAVSQFILKILVPLSIASWLTLMMGTGPATDGLLTIFVVFAAGLSCGYLGDLVFIRMSDGRYAVLVSRFYDMLTRKEVSFFREQKAGTLGALFRDHMDGTINLFRLLRTEIVPLVAATLLPALVLLVFDWRVAIIFALAVVLRGLAF